MDRYKKQKRNDILSVIRIYGIRGGISLEKLSHMVHLDPKNLREHYIRDLIKRELIKKGKGLQGKYFPSDEYYQDPLLSAKLFAESFKPFLKDRKALVLNNEKELTVFRHEIKPEVRTIVSKNQSHEVKITKADVYDFTAYKELYLRLLYLPALLERSQIQKTLFEFSNRIGAFVIRALIEAINQENYVGNDGTKDSREQENLAQEYTKKAVSTFAISLLPAFINLIETVPSIRNRRFETQREDVYVWDCSECGHHLEAVKDTLPDLVKAHQKSTDHTFGEYSDPIPTQILIRKDPAWFIFDKTITDQLSDAFRDLYPLLGYESDKILEKMPNSKESYRTFTESIYIKLEKQRTCKHEFKEPTITLTGHYVQQCSKCDEIRQTSPLKSKATRKE